MADGLSQQDRRALQKIAARLSRVEKAQRRGARTAQAGYRSIEGGAQEVYDDDGVLRGVMGLQADGTYTRTDLNAPAPQQPAAPGVESHSGFIVVSSYGLSADLSEWPADLARFDVHVGAPGFTHSPASKVAEFTDDGGAVTVALEVGDYQALLVAVNTSGVESVPSDPGTGQVVTPTVQLIPTMSGVSSHALYVKLIAPGVVAVSGYLDVDDGNTTRRDTGIRLPAGWEPVTDLVLSAPSIGTSNVYRYWFRTSGLVEFQQDSPNAEPFEGISGIWFTE